MCNWLIATELWFYVEIATSVYDILDHLKINIWINFIKLMKTVSFLISIFKNRLPMTICKYSLKYLKLWFVNRTKYCSKSTKSGC